MSVPLGGLGSSGDASKASNANNANNAKATTNVGGSGHATDAKVTGNVAPKTSQVDTAVFSPPKTGTPTPEEVTRCSGIKEVPSLGLSGRAMQMLVKSLNA